MSSTSTPIPLHRFAEAIRDLPLSNLHLKASEIHNSIVHLESSNQQLKPSADDGDHVCFDAIKENLEVIGRMRERISLLKKEVERRGFLWGEEENGTIPRVNGHMKDEVQEDSGEEVVNTHREIRQHGGSLSDEELAMRLQERIDEEGVGDDFANTNGGGVNL